MAFDLARYPMSEPLTFEECVRQSLADEDLVREFDRLYGTNLSGKDSTLDYEVRLASGCDGDDLHKFVVFVHQYVWGRLSPEDRNP
jgi:hypothetical protein